MRNAAVTAGKINLYCLGEGKSNPTAPPGPGLGVYFGHLGITPTQLTDMTECNSFTEKQGGGLLEHHLPYLSK